MTSTSNEQDRQTEATEHPEATRKHLRVIAIAIVAAIALFFGGAAVWYQLHPDRTIAGTVSFVDATAGVWITLTEDEYCIGQQANGNTFYGGQRITVHNSDEEIIGSGHLSAGQLESIYECRFALVAHLDGSTAKSDSYIIAFEDAGAAFVSFDQLERDDWEVFLELTP